MLSAGTVNVDSDTDTSPTPPLAASAGARLDIGDRQRRSKRRSPIVLSSVMQMLAALLAVGVLASLLAGQVLPLLVVAAVGYTVWHVARALDA